MRKMEINDISRTFVPSLGDITDDVYQQLVASIDSIEFLDLQSPQIRDVDIIWGKALFGSCYEKKLTSAQKLLSYLATRRNS